MTGIQYLLIDIITSDQTIQPLWQMHPLLHICWPVTSLRTVMESTRGAESVTRCYDNRWWRSYKVTLWSLWTTHWTSFTADKVRNSEYCRVQSVHDSFDSFHHQNCDLSMSCDRPCLELQNASLSFDIDSFLVKSWPPFLSPIILLCLTIIIRLCISMIMYCLCCAGLTKPLVCIMRDTRQTTVKPCIYLSYNEESPTRNGWDLMMYWNRTAKIYTLIIVVK